MGDETEKGGMSRRSFLKGLGALAVLALPACRRAQQFAVEAEECPEWMLPGETVCYTTCMPWATGALPMLAVCHKGLPIALQSNPLYEDMRRGVPAFAQATLLDLYSARRPSVPTRAGKKHPMQAIHASLRAWSRLLHEGRNMAFLFPAGYSAIRMEQVKELRRFNGAAFYEYDPVAAPRVNGFPELEALQEAAFGPAVQFNTGFGTLQELTERLPQLETLFIFTPADPAAFDTAFAHALENTSAETIRLVTLQPDRTAQLSLYTIPQTHFLEEWGAEADAQGNLCLRQPVTRPLREALSEADVLHALLNHGELPPTDGTAPSAAWEWLQRVVPNAKADLKKGFITAAAPKPQACEPAPLAEINWYLHPYYADGRFRHNPWLQENYLPLSGIAGAAEAFVAGDGKPLGIQCSKTLLPAWAHPGVQGTWIPLFPELATATADQLHRTQAPKVPYRPAKPLPPRKLAQPKLNLNSAPSPQWAMVIDLSRCIGCGACTLACRAENNIPTVSKEEQMYGRDLQWLRIDRYLSLDKQLRYVPMACRHCEKAPCEAVCPVNATQHTTSGLSAMVYPRCWGTRYCAAACPYHARTFNFRDYASGESQKTQRPHNPQVTVRSRGVMEKCTYCVQRINAASSAKQGTPQTACQQACPTGAIRLINLCESPLPPRVLCSFDADGTQPRTLYTDGEGGFTIYDVQGTID